MENDRRYWEKNAARYDKAMRLLGGPLPVAEERSAAAVDGLGDVLEVASGTGLFTVALAPRVERLVATDFAEAMVERTRARVEAAGLRNVRCETADLEALPYEAGAFDAVVAANVLHLVPDLDAALRSLGRVLRPGGKLVAPTFCHEQTFRSRLFSRAFGPIARFPGQRRFSVTSLAQAIEAAGFRVVKAAAIPGLLPIGFVEAERPLA